MLFSPSKCLDLCLGFIAVIIFANCFLNLSSLPIQDWDEARHGISAYEMLKSGNFLINTYNYAPDYWNLKPPLSFLSIVMGYKLFGYNTLGLRFFSALCACMALWSTLFFCARRITHRTAVWVGLIMISFQLFFTYHNARTGDPDALFLLFYISGLLLVLAMPGCYKAYYAASFLAGLAFLVKSFHTAPMALLLMVFFNMDFKLSAQSLKKALACLFIALAPVAIWAIARYNFDGLEFLSRMVTYDLLKRSGTSIEGHEGGHFYYVEYIMASFKYWLIGAAFSIMICLSMKARTKISEIFLPNQPVALLVKIALCIAIPFFMYSMAVSKLKWYIFCVYPFVALLVGIFIDHTYSLIRKKNIYCAGVMLAAFIFIAARAEFITLKKLIHPEKSPQTQTAMAELGDNPLNRGAKLFMTQGAWQPADELAARLYGDFVLCGGGEEAYEAGKNQQKSFLIITDIKQ